MTTRSQTKTRASKAKKASRGKKADDVIKEAGAGRSVADQELINGMREEIRTLRAKKAAPKVKTRKGRAGKHFARMIVPDSHGAHIDIEARDAFLRDLTQIQPREIVLLGDHLDCGGWLSAHQASYTNELRETFRSDINATNEFLDLIQEYSPNSEIHYIEGNHEAHIERWASRNFPSYEDARMYLEVFGPEGVLRLQERGIHYYRRSERYMDCSIHGTIRLGRVYFTHGISHSKYADTIHLNRFNASVNFGHVHRDISTRSRTVTSVGHGAWCPGTLAKLQPLYRHTTPTEWSHGYGLEFVSEGSGNFQHINVAILDGVSMLREMLEAVGG